MSRWNFTQVGPGTPAMVWRRHTDWGRGEALSLDGIDRLVVLAAHPDDETLGAGGLIAYAARLGRTVDIVCATDGERSHPYSPTHTPEELGRIRAEEARLAAEVLGADRVQRLELPDGDVEQRAGAPHPAPGRGRRGRSRDGHRGALASGRPSRPRGGRPRGGRGSASYGSGPVGVPRLVLALGRSRRGTVALAAPVRARRAGLSAKRRAIRAHASQVAPLSDLEGDETLLTEEMLAHFEDGPEHYLRTSSGGLPGRLARPAARGGGGPVGSRVAVVRAAQA